MIAHLPGSAYAYMEYENVEIYVGVKVRVEEAAVLGGGNSVALELSSMRKLVEEEGQEMKRIQYILNKRLIDKLAVSKEMTEFLQIPGARKHKVGMFIDVFFLTSPHVSQVEFVILAIKAALLSTVISEIDVSYNEVTEE